MLKNKENKRKKRLIIVLSISLFTIIAGTLAYFTTSTRFTNIFKTAIYQNSIVEEFTSPTTWTPGTTTPKTIKVTNTGNISMALRASYTEQWINDKGESISLIDANNNVASIINFNEGWTRDSDGYWYYGSKTNKTELLPNTTSNSFISGVTFNKNIQSTLTENVSADGKTVTYSSSGEGYDKATYKLVIKIDTVQYDQASDLWK